MLTWLKCRGEHGATSAEYAILIGLIAIVIIGAVTLLGENLGTLFQNSCNSMPPAGSC